MKDRFKFRIYCKSENKMMIFNNPTLIDGDILQGGLLFKNYDHKIKNVHEVKPEDLILMQCTGRKDERGELIYEKDIVRTWKFSTGRTQLSVVVWNEARCGFRLYDIDKYLRDIHCSPQSMVNVTTIEIRGNVYENPELLERQHD